MIWARETAGLSVADAAKKLAIKPEVLTALENGQTEPTRKQILKFAEKYRRPLLAFYMPEPPRPMDRGEDFRSLPSKSPDAEALLDTLLRNVKVRQQLVRAALEETEEDKVLSYVASARMDDGVDSLIASMRLQLKFSTEEFRAAPTPSEAFKKLRSAAEDIGVFVLLMGNLGTHHTDIDVSVFRGFALADRIAPFIVINEKDSQSAWSFTLLHELAHIWLGQTGVSGYRGNSRVEKFCDEVAARYLLDPQELAQLDSDDAPPKLAQTIGDFARDRNLSRKMVAYNLLRNDSISPAVYDRLATIFDTERLAARKKDRKDGGPNYYIVRRHRVGEGVVNVVSRMLASGALTTPKAGTVLGVKATAVDQLIRNRAAGGRL